jgi:hypothetical protein
MTEVQRSLAGYKSKVHEQGEFENPNEGKPLLTEYDEYVFKLIKFPHVKTMPQPKKDKTGKETVIQVDKAICEFEEEITKNQILAFWRVDSLNFSDDDFESAILRFFRKIGTPVPQSENIDWEKYFLVGMRFRGRVAIGKGQDKQPNGKYFIDVPTCRPILASDKHPESYTPAQTVTDAPPAAKPTALLANAMIIIHGCANSADAYQRLLDAKVSVEVVQEFLAADKSGKISYPC